MHLAPALSQYSFRQHRRVALEWFAHRAAM